MFADDLLFFEKATEEEMIHVTETFQTSCDMLGQEVSNEKTSVLFSNNFPKNMKVKLTQISSFQKTNQLGKYLGVPLSGKYLKRIDYQYVVEQISSNHAIWKSKQLSFAGRVTLAKSVMKAIMIYLMMTNMMPKMCIDEIHGL